MLPLILMVKGSRVIMERSIFLDICRDKDHSTSTRNMVRYKYQKCSRDFSFTRGRCWYPKLWK